MLVFYKLSQFVEKVTENEKKSLFNNFLDCLHILQCLSSSLQSLVLGLHDVAVVLGHGLPHQELGRDGDEGAKYAAQCGAHTEVMIDQH